jgi:hypothetical protein
MNNPESVRFGFEAHKRHITTFFWDCQEIAQRYQMGKNGILNRREPRKRRAEEKKPLLSCSRKQFLLFYHGLKQFRFALIPKAGGAKSVGVSP